MRLSLVVAALSLAGLAACTSAPDTKAPAAPVQANQAATQGDTADTAQQQPRARRKYCNTGSRLCTDSPDTDPANGMPASGLSNTTSNTAGGSPK